LFCDSGADAVDLVPDIDSVRYGPFMIVLHDQILVEKAECL
jgi:hypothetical protein